MLERLKEKWGVGPGRAILILVTFALGGSLTGYLAKKILSAIEIDTLYLYIPVYIYYSYNSLARNGHPGQPASWPVLFL